MHYKYLPILAFMAPAALAADNLPEELVVSGYRPVATQELDTSISLLDGETVARATLSGFEQVVQLVPNMNMSGEGSRARYFQLRGVGEREQYEGAPNPSVGFIIDDIDLSGIGGVVATYDVKQIEVLRGPQSARYGSSALAGMVYVQTASPSDEFSLDTELSIGSEDTLIAGAAVGGGLTDNVNGRLSVYQYQDDGFRRNNFSGRDNTNERDELTVRGKLSWEINEDWDALLTGFFADFDNGYDAWTVSNSEIMQSDNPGRDAQETTAFSLKVSGPATGAFEFVSITAYASSDVDFSFDGDWGNPDFWVTYGNFEYDYTYENPRERDTLSQEFRLVSTPDGRLFNDTTDWVLGARWRNLDEDNEITSLGLYTDAGEGDFCLPCLTERRISSDFESDTYAFFAALDSSLSTRLTLSLGLRLERWEAEYADTWSDINYVGPPNSRTCDVAELNCEPDDTLWGGHVALGYDWSDELNGYARISRGFKAGGFNPSLAALQGSGTALGEEFLNYGDETLWNYELGLKGVLLDGDLDLDLAVFYMDRDDAQLSQSSQQVAFDPNSFVYVSYNGDAEVTGLEASANWRLNDSLELHAALGLLDSEIKSGATTDQVSPDAAGRSLAHAPDYTLNLGVTWSGPDGLYARLDMVAVDEFYFDISHNQKSDSYEVFNLRIGKEWDQWAVSVWGRNIFDEDYATRGFFFGNEPPGFEETLYTKFGDPRQVGLTLSYQY